MLLIIYQAFSNCTQKLAHANYKLLQNANDPKGRGKQYLGKQKYKWWLNIGMSRGTSMCNPMHYPIDSAFIQ